MRSASFSSRHCLPVVLDAMILADDVVQGAIRDHETALVAAAEHGTTRLIVSRHVLEEVERLLPRRAAANGVPESDAFARWQQSHLPVLQAVDVPGDWGANDPRVEHTARSDASDAPTARLVAALAPAFSFGRDKSLTAPGLAVSEWLPFALAAADLAVYHDGVDGLDITARLSAAAARGTVSAFLKLSGSAQLVLSGGGIVLAGVTWGSRRKAGAGALRRVGYATLFAFATLEELRRSAEAGTVTVIEAVAGRSPSELVASRLAVAPVPLTANELGTDLGWSTALVRSHLDGCSAFVRSGGGGWTLGRSAAAAVRESNITATALIHRVRGAADRVRQTNPWLDAVTHEACDGWRLAGPACPVRGE